MSDEEKRSPIEQLSKTVSALDGNMSKERRGELYFGKPPKTAYFGFNRKDIKNIHDLTMSEEQKNRLYGIGRGQEDSVGDVVSARLGTDSRSDLVRELADNTTLTRRDAEQLVDMWMLRNDLTEVDDPKLGKIIVPKRG